MNLNLLMELEADPEYAAQMGRVFDWEFCQIEPTFLCDLRAYDALSRIIPLDRVVYDLGCNQAVQSYLFREHRGYVGVDQIPIDARLLTPNALHYRADIEDFLAGLERDDPHFAICNWVPGDSHKFVRAAFTDLWVLYPKHFKHMEPSRFRGEA
jgi:hypothetical protein